MENDYERLERYRKEGFPKEAKTDKYWLIRYRSLEREEYLEALGLMVKLRKPVDDFFDGVEVLTKDDQALRENRVGLLQQIAGLMLLIADFSKFSI